MIDFANWTAAWKLVFLISPFVIGLSGVALIVRIALTREFDVVMSAITNNPYLERMKQFWGVESLRSRCLLVSAVSSLVTFPGPQLRRGWLCHEEVRNFPADLKRRLNISLWLVIIGSLWFFTGFLLIKYQNSAG
ncbi:hypothetical protein [Pseudomonas putida]